MNSTTYIFGGISGNSEEIHFQFPDDYTSTVFRRIVGISSNETVLAVSFDNSLAYHIFYRHTSNGYFGFGVLLNGCWVREQQRLLSVFNDAYVDAISSGIVLSINDKGGVQCNAYAIKHNEQEATRITERLRSIINTLSQYTRSLPVIDVSTNPNFIHKLPDNATDSDWRSSVGKYRSQYSVYGNVKSNFSQILKRLQRTIQERERYAAKCDSLQEEITKINKQKKQYKLVIGLAMAMFVGALVAIAIISDKNTKIENQLATIQNNKETISSQGNIISTQKNTINEQLQTISSLNGKVDELESKYNSLESDYSSITSTYPFNITSIEIGNTYSNGSMETDYGYSLYSARTMYLKPKIYYYGYTSGSHELKVKWYTPSGEIKRETGSPTGYSQSESVYFYTGSNYVSLAGWGSSTKGHWSAGKYRIEIWYNNMCLKSKTFTIY